MKKKILILLCGFCFLVGCGSAPKTSAKRSKARPTYNANYDAGDPANQDAIEDLIYSELSKNRKSGLKKYAVPTDIHSLAGVKFDIPMTTNNRVEAWVDYFANGNGRKHYERWLARSTRFVPYQLKTLRELNLPRDIIFLSMIESGFNTHAYSFAAASGLWQFIRSTGRLYGLESNYWVDERRDVEKATLAAARHLKDLYEEFGDWYLAFAAYNAGSGKVRRAIQATGSRDFWKLASTRYLRQETKDYVPKILAAAIVAKSPERFGFKDIEYQRMIPTEKVKINSPTDLATIAECAGVDLDLIRLVNPELIRSMTPLSRSQYELNLPRGTKATFQARYAELSPSDRLKNVRYVTARAESLRALAKKRGVNIASIQNANPSLGVRKNIPKGTTLLIPQTYNAAPDFSVASAYAAPASEGNSLIDLIAEAPRKSKSKKKDIKKKEDVNVVVAEQSSSDGEMKVAWKEETTNTNKSILPNFIAKEAIADTGSPTINTSTSTGISVSNELNKTEDSTQTSSGAIELTEETHEAKKIEMVDQEIDESLKKIESPNKKTKASLASKKIVAQLEKETKKISKKQSVKIVKYKVRKGDTLYKIAQKYDVSLAEIRKVNGLNKKSSIRPGSVLKIHTKEFALNKG